LRPNTKIVVNLFDGGARDSVWVSIDKGERAAMSYVVRTDPFIENLSRYEDTENAYSGVSRSSHIWEINMPEDLSLGLHLIKVDSLDEFGQSRGAAMTFEIVTN
jgi:hypothetical protein